MSFKYMFKPIKRGANVCATQTAEKEKQTERYTLSTSIIIFFLLSLRVRANVDKNGARIRKKSRHREMSSKMESHAGSTLNVRSCEMSEKYTKTLHKNTHKSLATNNNADVLKKKKKDTYIVSLAFAKIYEW